MNSDMLVSTFSFRVHDDLLCMDASRSDVCRFAASLAWEGRSHAEPFTHACWYVRVPPLPNAQPKPVQKQQRFGVRPATQAYTRGVISKAAAQRT